MIRIEDEEDVQAFREAKAEVDDEFDEENEVDQTGKTPTTVNEGEVEQPIEEDQVEEEKQEGAEEEEEKKEFVFVQLGDKKDADGKPIEKTAEQKAKEKA